MGGDSACVEISGPPKVEDSCTIEGLFGWREWLSAKSLRRPSLLPRGATEIAHSQQTLESLRRTRILTCYQSADHGENLIKVFYRALTSKLYSFYIQARDTTNHGTVVSSLQRCHTSRLPGQRVYDQIPKRVACSSESPLPLKSIIPIHLVSLSRFGDLGLLVIWQYTYSIDKYCMFGRPAETRYLSLDSTRLVRCL